MGFMLLYDIFESWLCDLFKLICNDIITASLSSDTDSRTVRTVNMATLTVWRLGTNQYYVHVKTILNSATTTKHYQIKNLKI